LKLILILTAIGGPVLALFAIASLWRSFRRKKLLILPFPAAWESILQRTVALYQHLPQALKQQLQADIQLFLAEKHFEGAGGLEMSDEVRITIAAQACMLLLNRKDRNYPGLDSIVVYPGAYVAAKRVSLGTTYVEEPSVRLGESWHRGTVVLAWDQVQRDAHYPASGHSVVLHEFAHQLDQENGRSDGVPLLENRSGYAAWARILSREYLRLQQDIQHHRKSLLDTYGATNPAEFFAVATEAFFTRPQQMQHREPELYAELKEYYKVDPAAWVTHNLAFSGNEKPAP
jgi:Mlc titration factor MtfA (ptsG expression regulator)